MQAGRLNQKITLLKFEREESATNQKTKGRYVPWKEVWAEALCTQTQTSEEGGAVVFITRWKFNIRKRPGIQGNMRIAWKGRTFELTGPPIDWSHEKNGLTLMAREVT